MEWKQNFKGLQHIGIPTNDMDRTVEFYHKIILHLMWKRLRKHISLLQGLE